jgi:hypothetical protein
MILTNDIITTNVSRSIISTVGGGGRWRGVMNVTLNGCAMECIVFRNEYAKGGNIPIALHHVNHHAVEAISLSLAYQIHSTCI